MSVHIWRDFQGTWRRNILVSKARMRGFWLLMLIVLTEPVLSYVFVDRGCGGRVAGPEVGDTAAWRID